MPILLALGMLALQKPSDRVTLLPEPPAEKTWPMTGTITRPDETLLQVFALRLERRWDTKIGKFRETPSQETRVWGRAQVTGGHFQASLPMATAGFYQLSVSEEGKDLHTERLLLGGAPELASTWTVASKTLDPCRARILDLCTLAGKVSRKEAGGGAAQKKAFQAALGKEDQILEAAAETSDFTAAPTILRGILWHLRNAQIWLAQGDAVEGKFMDPTVTFPSLEASLALAKDLVWAEQKASIATLLSELLRGQDVLPPKRLALARRMAGDALRALGNAPEPEGETDFKKSVAAAAAVDEKSLGDVRDALRTALGSLLDRP